MCAEMNCNSVWEMRSVEKGLVHKTEWKRSLGIGLSWLRNKSDDKLFRTHMVPDTQTVHESGELFPYILSTGRHQGWPNLTSGSSSSSLTNSYQTVHISIQSMISRHQVMPNYMQQNPSLEANTFSVSQETFRILWKQEIHYYLDKFSQLVSVMNQDDEIYVFPTFSLIFTLVLSHHIFLGLLRWLSAILFTTKLLVLMSSSPNVLHAPSI